MVDFNTTIDASAGINLEDPPVQPKVSTDISKPYGAARVTKLNDHWRPNHYSGDRAIRESWSLMTARIRDLVRNDSVLSKCKSTLQWLTVGTGVRSFSEASELDPDNEQLVAFELESDTWFDRWAMEEADAEGEHSFWEMQSLAFGDQVEAGNCLWLEVLDNDPSRTVPLSFQLIEWEQVDMTKDRDAAMSRSRRGRKFNRISNGIEYDSRNRKVAYHLWDSHPYDSSAFSESRRIPANRIIHQYRPHRPSAKLGVTWFAPIAQTNKDFDKLNANELTTRALQALMALAIKSNDHACGTGLDAEDPDTGVKKFKLGYPFVGELAPGDEVEIIESKRSTNDLAPLQNLMLNLHAMGSGISLNRLLGDPSKANLASLKAAHRDDDASIAPIQHRFARSPVREIRKRHMRWAFAKGLIRTYSASDYQRKPLQFNQFSEIPSGRYDLDKDDIEAAIDRLRSGLSYFKLECARRGLHWRRVLAHMKQVAKAAEKAGVVLDWTKGQGMVPDSSTTIAGDERSTEGTANAA